MWRFQDGMAREGHARNLLPHGETEEPDRHANAFGYQIRGREADLTASLSPSFSA
jgi:hypothetical protein